MNLWSVPQIVGSFYFQKFLTIIDQSGSLFVLVMKEVFEMDLEKLKTAANKINMPQDMKERIMNVVQQSYTESHKQKEAHRASNMGPGQSKRN